MQRVAEHRVQNCDSCHREEKVYKAKKTLLQRKNILRYVHLFYQAASVQDGRHRAASRLRKHIEQSRARQIVNRDILNVDLKYGRENRRNDHHHKQRIQDAPQYAQHRAPIFEFYVLHDEVSQKMLVPPECLQICLQKFLPLALSSLWLIIA